MRQLKRIGVDVTVVSNGKEALDAYTQNTHDNMPAHDLILMGEQITI